MHDEIEIVTVITQRVNSAAAGIDRNVRPTGPNVTAGQKADAVELALEWVHVADERRVSMADLDMVTSLASSALDAVRCRDRRLASTGEANPFSRTTGATRSPPPCT